MARKEGPPEVSRADTFWAFRDQSAYQWDRYGPFLHSRPHPDLPVVIQAGTVSHQDGSAPSWTVMAGTDAPGHRFFQWVSGPGTPGEIAQRTNRIIREFLLALEIQRMTKLGVTPMAFDGKSSADVLEAMWRDIQGIPLVVDVWLLRSAVGELMHNAIEWSEGGGGELSWWTEDGKLHLLVADPGVGVHARMQRPSPVHSVEAAFGDGAGSSRTHRRGKGLYFCRTLTDKEGTLPAVHRWGRRGYLAWRNQGSVRC